MTRRGTRIQLPLACLAGLAAAWFGVGCGPTSFLITPVPARQALEETVIVRESIWTQRRIALVSVDGLIENADERSLTGLPQENPVMLFKEKLDKAAGDDRVKAVVLRINSPGGTVTASDIMYQELVRFREQTAKPVVAVMLDLGTSGGYYLACGADKLVVHPTTVTGSIGVVMLLPNLSGTLDKIGAAVNIIKSGEYKDAGSPFRPLDDDDRALFEDLVAKMYARFFAVVRRARGDVAEAELRELADGRVFLGTEAVELGLADAVGSVQSAIVDAKALAGLADRPVLVVQYGRPLEFRPNVYAKDGGRTPRAADWATLAPSWVRHSTPRPLYLWSPGW